MALKEKFIIDMNFKIEAPRILIPQNCESEDTPVFLMDLGKLSVKSDMDIEEKEKRLKKTNLSNEDVYDLYKVRLTDIYGLFTSYNEIMNDKLSKDQEEHLILKDVNLAFNFYNSIIPDNLSFSRFKLKSEISPIQFYLSPKKIETIVRILNNMLVLAENPKGVKFTQLKHSSTLKVQTPKDSEPTECWVELREKNGILIFKNEKSKNPIKKINIFNPQTSLVHIDAKTFKILLPQQDERVLEIILESENEKVVDTWVKSVREMIIDYSNSLVLSGKDSESLEDEARDGDDKETTQQTIIDVEFLMKELCVIVEEEKKRIVSTSFKNLFVTVNVRKFDVSMNAKLSSFDINNQDSYDIIRHKETDDNDVLLKFSLVHVMSHRSDLFDKEAETKMNVHLNDLVFVFEPETLSHLMKFGFRMLNTAKLIKPKLDSFKVTEKTGTRRNGNFKLCTSFDSLSIEFEEKKSLFASCSVTSGVVTVLVSGNEVDVSGKLGDLVLLDHDNSTNHKEIIGLKDKQESVIEFKYHQLVSTNHIETPSYTKSLSLNISCIKVVYLQRFVSNCLQYLKSVQLLPLMKEYAEKEQKSKKITENTSHVDPGLFSLDIKIHSPLFMIPVSPVSADYISGSLGMVTIKNSINQKGNAVTDLLDVNIRDINMNTFISETKSPIIRNTDVNVKIDRAILNPDHIVHDIEIGIQISKIETILSRSQYQFIFNILKENIFDKHAVNTIKESNPLTEIEVKGKKPDDIITGGAHKKLLLGINMNYMDLTIADKSDVHITQFIIRDMEFQLGTLSDNSLNGNFSLHDITVIDLREDTDSAFSEIISTVNIDSKSSQLYKITFEKIQNSKFVLGVQVGSLRFMFIPDYILDVKAFINPEKLTQDVVEMTELFKNQKRLDNSVSQVSINEVKGTSKNMEIDVSTEFNNLMLAFPEDKKDQDSRLIVAESGVIIKFSKTSEILGSLKLTDISIYPQLSIISKDIKVEHILEPFTVDVNFKSQEKMKKFTSTIGIDQIKTSISYQDFKSAIKIIKPMKEFVDNLKSSQQKISKEIQHIEKSKPSEIIKDEISLHLTFKMKSNSLYIVDDFTGIDFPLFEIDAKNTEFEMNLVQSKTLSVKSTANSIIHANYFNQKYSEWEPCIEAFHFDFQFNIKENPESKSTPFTYSSIIGDEHKKFPLSINITQSMLETTKKTIAIWTEGISGEHKIRTKFYPYLVKNHSGKHLKITKVHDDNEIIELKDRGELNLEFGSISNTHQLYVHIEGIGKKTLDVAKVQQYHFTDFKKLNIFVDIELIEGIKVITIRSGLRIFNNSTIAWSVKDSVGKGNDLGSLKPGEYMGLPYYSLGEGSLVIQPTELKDSYDWSSVADSLKYEQLMRSTAEFHYIECSSKNVRESTLAYFAIIKFHPKDSVKTETMTFSELGNLDAVIEISCPFSFENLLECPLDYQFYDKTTWKSKELMIANGTLNRGEKVYFYNFDLKNITLLKCKPHGDQWKFDDNYSLVYANSKKNGNPMASNCFVTNKDYNESTELLFDYGSNSQNTLKEIMVYVQTWLINRTNLDILLHDNEGKTIKLKDEKTVSLYSASPKQKFRASLSDKKSSTFSLEAVGAENSFTLERESKYYDICFSVHLAPGRFSRTKIVTFSPKITIFNKIDETVHLKQFNCNTVLDLGQDKSMKYYFEKNTNNQMLTINIDGFEFSEPFKINSDGESIIKLLPKSNDKNLDILYLRVETQLNNGSLFVVLSKSEKAPYTFDNQTMHLIEFHQIDQEKKWKIEEHSTLMYSWDNNFLAHKIEMKVENTKFELDLNRIMETTEFSIGNEKIYISMQIHGLTKMITISHKEQENTSFKKAKGEAELIHINSFIPAVGISLINDEPSEIAFIFLEKLNVTFSQTATRRFVEAKMENLEINDQTKYCLFPVIFSSSRKKKEKEFIHFSLTQSLDESSILEFPYFSFAMQEATIQVDYVFIKTFSSFLQNLIKKNDKDQNLEVEKQLTSIVEMSAKPKNDKKFYFNTFELHPIKASISFQFNKPRGETITNNPIMTVLNSLGQTVGGIDEVSLCLNSLILINPLETKDSLITKIKTHYQRCVTLEFYKIIGGLDMIGNPVGLFSDVNAGISDFFYEPAQAIFLVQSPQEVASGIGRGTQSLIYGTLHGTFGSAAKVTKSVQKGLNFLTFDEDFIKEKEEKSKKKSYGLQAGLEDGSKEMLDGFSEGLGGLFWQPVTGAQQEGIGGFIKGVGKGLIGAPVKSVSGVVNFFAKTTEGISNTGRKDIQRIRYPRTFRKDGLLIPYSYLDSQIRFALDNYFDKKYKNEEVVAYLKMKNHSLAVLTKRILFIFTENYVMDAEINLKSIEKVEMKNEIIITIPKQGLFSFAATHTLDSPNKQELKNFYNDIQQARK